MKSLVYLVAGGTGGHINAALSLGEALEREFYIKYLSGTRYLDYQLFKDKKVIHLESKPLRTKNPIILIKNICINIIIFLRIFFLYLKQRPMFLIGAGGYVCGPTLLAAWIIGIPVYIIEQNAVFGMTNKLLSKIANKIFVNFENTKGIQNTKKVIVSGNPVRSKIKFHPTIVEKNMLKILVFGGSLGATQVNETINYLIKNKFSKKIKILHQVGKNNLSDISVNESVEYKQVEYIDNMDEAYNECNIIVARAGASTISELREIKKPAILIPFPQATDNHQFHNAINLMNEDNFYVKVLDHKKSSEELSLDIKIVLDNISDEELHKAVINDNNISAVNIIIKEIKKCLE